MARIVLGIGSSHSPALLMEPPAWLARGQTDDRAWSLYDEVGARVRYDDLLARHGQSLAPELADDVLAARHAANEAGIAAIAAKLRDADPDVVMIVGDDHKELFDDDNFPSLSVFWGESLRYRPTGFMKWKYAEDLKAEVWYPQGERDYPVASGYAERLIGDLLEHGFDPAQTKYFRDEQSMSHSFGYIFHRIMTEKTWPVIPVTINTYYPPNQITPRRAYQLGRAIRRIVEGWPEDLRVCVLATGGLSHFVVDEQLDRRFIEVLRNGGEEEHAALPRELLQSGNSEMRCWSVVAGATEGMLFDLIDYVPCYRSLAGTGCGMAFATWE
ncbi:DODA-type extradiol aromatic ring-opening family dioxygenase [Novosphingobium aerophilum]|uniref:Extradiol ring-cleavage dioxygenase n=1 Tax=Novosphingobium aerophilum TaxID=2839843 RepID=A0A7X1KDN9_9SPHN|nr:extradiol ring-cleavage dioxygenase [Novosphingobium aerophilum]MBC2653463.1 extradiol ring-cleavage dioxygenase [Novosphingobium aerophilum]